MFCSRKVTQLKALSSCRPAGNSFVTDLENGSSVHHLFLGLSLEDQGSYPHSPPGSASSHVERQRNYQIPFLKFWEITSPFCGATDFPILAFWWASKLGWIPSLACFLACVHWIPYSVKRTSWSFRCHIHLVSHNSILENKIKCYIFTHLVYNWSDLILLIDAMSISQLYFLLHNNFAYSVDDPFSISGRTRISHDGIGRHRLETFFR